MRYVALISLFLSFSRAHELPYFFARQTRSALQRVGDACSTMRLGCDHVAVHISRLARFLEDIRAGPDRLSNLHEGHVTLQSSSRSVLHVGWAQGQCQWVSRTNRATAPLKVFAEFALRRKMDARSASLSYSNV